MMAADRARHAATVEALQRQLQNDSEAHAVTRRLMAAHVSTLEDEINSPQGRLRAESPIECLEPPRRGEGGTPRASLAVYKRCCPCGEIMAQSS